MGARAKLITPATQTTAAQFSKMDERFTPNWDKAASGQQGMVRAAERARMGIKMSPRLGGKLIRKGK